MASIPTPPFKLSLVTDEWKNKSIKSCGDKAGLTTPFKCTEFVGKSDWVFVKFSGKQHNFDFNTFYNACDSALGGNWSGKQLHIIFESDAQYVSKDTSVPCIKLDRNFTQLATCTLEVNGHIVGRGGAGKLADSGRPGGPGIQLASGVKVSINNKGIIAGGGGGGGGQRRISGGDDPRPSAAGGGGAPFGSSRASYDTPERTVSRGGTWGNAGESSQYSGGVAGKAINVSGASITWVNRGDIRGAVS